MRHGRLLCVSAIGAMLASAPGLCATPRFTVGVQAWNTQVAGNIYNPRFSDQTRIGLRDDLKMGRHWNPNFVFAAFATPGALPDVRLEYGTLAGGGFASGHREICYGGTTYQADASLTSQAAIKQGRILFYWEPVNNSFLTLRLGPEARWVSLNLAFTGTATVVGTGPCAGGASLRAAVLAPTGTGKASISTGVVAWLPDFDLGLIFHLPANFDIYFDGSALPRAHSYLYDFRVGFKYRLAAGLGLIVGYRRWRLHLDDGNLNVNGDLEFKGPYAGISWTF